MLSTFQALFVAVLALLPGAFYTFAYDSVAGSFGMTAADRFVRFFAASAIFHGLLGPTGAHAAEGSRLSRAGRAAHATRGGNTEPSSPDPSVNGRE